MKCSVLGAGAWGTTLAVLLHYNGHKVTVWELKEEYASSMRETRENAVYFPGVPLPEEMRITSDIKEATFDKNILVLAVPSQYLRSALLKIDYEDVKDCLLVSVAKGIENGSLMTMSQVVKDVFPYMNENQIGVLSGPSHAEEVIKMIPTTVVAACKSLENVAVIQAAFMNSYFRVYATDDIIGVELGGAFKNVIAIGAGIIDGVGYGDNTKAAIMTRGISEITRLGMAMGSRPETFPGLSGIGDLIVTCMSKHSRNRYVGEKIGAGMKLKEVLDSMTAVAEGVYTSKSALELAEKHNVDTPITREVFKILYEGKDPIRATADLMMRNKKRES